MTYPPSLCEHCRRREAVIGLRVHWRAPLRLCALCYSANEASSTNRRALSAPLNVQ